MQHAPAKTIFSEITDFLVTNPTPQEIIDYQLPDDLEARTHELLDLNGEGLLSEAEREEMFVYVRVDEMMSLLKAKTKRRLRAG